MERRMRVGVVYGGRSGEHEVSLRSAASIVAALDPARYEVVPVAITKDGRWLTGPESLKVLEAAQRDLAPIPEHGSEVTLPADPTRHGLLPLGRGEATPLDVVFPDAGIPVCRWLVARIGTEEPHALAQRVGTALGFPCFVKPANLGSSVGITKVKEPAGLAAAVAEAGAYDPKVVIEEAIDGREFECAVLGNDAPQASVVGELVPSREFYDYADKYVEQGAEIVIPARIPPETAEAMRALAVRAFRAVDCSGLARVDFFLERGGRVLVNEINTMPGFTAISMYPKLWEASGLPYPALVDRLIVLALERQAARGKRRLSFTPPAPAAPAGLRRARQ